MEIFQILKQLKNIKPESDYASRSRRLILGDKSVKEFPNKLTPGEWIINNLGAAAALALASLLLFIIIGGFSSWQALSPLKLSALDPQSLRAEAQAIDAQIELTNINYNSPGTSVIKHSESTPPSASLGTETATSLTETSSTNSTSSDNISLDEALDKLSQ